MGGIGSGIRNKEIGELNLERVRWYFVEHLCATHVECAMALNISPKTVSVHVKTLRNEWLSPDVDQLFDDDVPSCEGEELLRELDKLSFMISKT